MKLPVNYMGFLRVDSNKEAFFLLIALELSKIVLPPNKRLYTTFKDQVLCTEGSPLTLTRCTHEEADTRMFVHVADQVSHGYTRILMKTPDSDNVVLAVYVFGQIPGIRELWIAYGSYPNLRWKIDFITVWSLSVIFWRFRNYQYVNMASILIH